MFDRRERQQLTNLDEPDELVQAPPTDREFIVLTLIDRLLNLLNRIV